MTSSERARAEGLHWDALAPEQLRAAVLALPTHEGEGRVAQIPDGRIVGADEQAQRLLHMSWDQLTGVTSTDPRWHACASDGSEVPGEDHPAMVSLRTGQPLRGFVLGIDAPTEDGLGTFVWLAVDADPLRGSDGAIIGVCTRFRDVSESEVGRRATQSVIRSYRRAAHEAAAQGERFRVMVEASSDVVLEAGGEGVVTWASPSVRDVLGFDPDDVVGLSVVDLVHQLDRRSAQEQVAAVIAGDEAAGRDELRMRTVDGAALWMSAAWRPLLGSGGQSYGVLVSLRDVHADVERREALAHMAHHDGLTGLLNRDSAYAWLRSELSSAHELGRHVGVLYLDVDRFKQVNDTHGHGVGDKVLASVGECLTAAVREEDMVARAGGDEFIVALRAVPDAGAVERRAQAVLDNVRALTLVEASDVRVSIGLALDDGTSDVDALVQRADDALYRAKHAGRDRFSW
jgi:diguanylate cyclase (GGDEF)-like protein/PAS domain S-box-containing protein